MSTTTHEHQPLSSTCYLKTYFLKSNLLQTSWRTKSAVRWSNLLLQTWYFLVQISIIPVKTSKAIPLQACAGPWGFQEVEAPRFQDNRHMKLVRLSAVCTSHFYPQGNISGTHFCYRLSQPQGHSEAGRIMSLKNSNDTTGNRTHDLLTCSAVPQPTAPLHTVKTSMIT